MKPKLVFINGWGFDKRIFNYLRCDMKSLINEDYDEIFIDPVYEYDNNVDNKDYSHLRDESDKYIICWSLGTTHFLENIEMFNNIKGVIIISGTLCFLKSGDYNLGWDFKIVRRMSNKLKINPCEVMKDFARNSSTGFCSYTHYDHIRESIVDYDDSNVTTLGHCLEHITKRSLECLNNIDPKYLSTLKPLIIHGKCDNIIDIKCGKYMHKTIPDSTMVVLENCGHIPHVTHSRYISSVIINYIKEMEQLNDK